MDPARLRAVELASIAILGLFLAAMIRFGLRAAPAGRATPRAALGDIGLIAAGAWVAEVSCIRLYGFYQYDAPWLLFVDVMPALVALIWPFVILSAREVVHALGWRDAAGRPHALAVGLLVVYDASLVEPIAVRTGLWSWNEPGLWAVPIIGILGWGYYAASASALLDRRRWLVPLLAPLLTHGLLLGSWWGALRWVARDAVRPAVAVGLGVAAALLGAVLVRRRPTRAALVTMVPRMAAAGLFFVLLFVAGGQDVALVAYGLTFALPYVLATAWTRAAPPAATPG